MHFYIHICVYIIIYTNIFLKCAYLHIHKNIIYILLAAAIYTYCTSYRMHFLFFFLFILCTPIYPFFISFLCIHYHIYFCWRHLPAPQLFQRAGNNIFAFLFVCIFYMLFKWFYFLLLFLFLLFYFLLFLFFVLFFLFVFCFSLIFLPLLFFIIHSNLLLFFEVARKQRQLLEGVWAVKNVNFIYSLLSLFIF